MIIAIVIEGLVVSVKQRTITALLLILGVIPLFFSESYLHLIVILVAFIAALELNDLIADQKYPLIIGLNFALMVSLGLDFIASYDKTVVLAIFLFIYVLFDLVYNEIGFNHLALMYAVSMLVGFALNAFVTLYAVDGWLILYVLIANYGSDTGAYLVGSTIGKHKLIPKISPNKTVEGAIGGVLMGGILSVLFAYFFVDYNINFLLIVFVSFFIPIMGQLGDLFFSSLKRSYNKKDFGGTIPGHGGVLDRIDSLVFALVFMVVLIRIIFLGGLL